MNTITPEIIIPFHALSVIAQKWLAGPTAQSRVMAAIEAAARENWSVANAQNTAAFLALAGFVAKSIEADPRSKLAAAAALAAARAYFEEQRLPWPGPVICGRWLKALILSEFDVRACHDVPNPITGGRVRGWRGLRIASAGASPAPLPSKSAQVPDLEDSDTNIGKAIVVQQCFSIYDQ
jgi:hypothetical protein